MTVCGPEGQQLRIEPEESAEEALVQVHQVDQQQQQLIQR